MMDLKIIPHLSALNFDKNGQFIEIYVESLFNLRKSPVATNKECLHVKNISKILMNLTPFEISDAHKLVKPINFILSRPKYTTLRIPIRKPMFELVFL